MFIEEYCNWLKLYDPTLKYRSVKTSKSHFCFKSTIRQIPNF